jgi:2-polyprenyl-6-methoxyphenol hydroxylase-like FAD-dependent oxidoreductase
MTPAVDIIIGGGGIAGLSVAAALAESGYEVLVVEPGVDSAKRLAGELIHPPGANDLAELGFLRHLERAGVCPVLGFAVVPDATSAAYLLPYGEIPGVKQPGFAMDHGTLVTSLRSAVDVLPNVTVWAGARVTGVDPGHSDFITVTVTRDKRDLTLRARLLVAADGSMSPIRRLAGIGREKHRISRMVGYLLEGVRLPCPGFGNVFLGGPAPAFAYSIAPETVRLMFDIPGNPQGIEALRRDATYLQAFPEPFRRDVQNAVETQGRLVSTNYSIVPQAVSRGRLVLVGDAAGSCHPLTATGLSVCTRDAIRLRQALRETNGDILAAVGRYTRLRHGAQSTRVALAEALYETFVARTPEMRLLREALLRFWRSSRGGRAASMALLSTHEGRMSVMLLLYARVVARALAGLVRRRSERETRSLPSRQRVALMLSRATLRRFREGIKGL